MDMRQILKYLADLSENNNWEWYHAHRMENDAANTQFEELVQTLIFRIGNLTVLFYITGQKTLFLNWFGIPGLAMTDLRLIHLFVRIFHLRESSLSQWDII